MIRRVALGDVADVNWGDTSVTKASYREVGYPAYSASGNDGFLPYADYDREAIILSAIGAQCGKTWYAKGKWSCIKNTIRLWSISSDLDNRFLYWATAEQKFWPKRGAAQPFITIGDARKAEIPLPALDEQRRIAVVLDQVDDLRRKRRRTLERLSDLDDALFVEIFGDPKSNTYPLVNFSDICERITVGIVVRPASYYQESGAPALRSLNIGKNEFNLDNLVYFSKKDNETTLSKTRVFTGDVVAVRTGQPGKAAVIPDTLHGVNTIDLLIMTPHKNDVQPLYLCGYLNSAAGKRMVLSSQRGQIQQHLNVGSLSDALIPLPPIPLQLKYLEASNAANELKRSYRAHLTELDALFASLQHRAFRGELTPASAARTGTELELAG